MQIKIEAAFRAFFWDGIDLKKTKENVAWDEVCVLKDERGLGIMRIGDWNKDAMMRHLWNITQIRSNSRLTTWVKSYNMLMGKSFWEVLVPNKYSWAWRQVLKLRRNVRSRIRTQVGNG